MELTHYEPVPMARWSKDHWSTLAYVETRLVDHRGLIAAAQMRTDHSRHMSFVGAVNGGDAHGRYPTRLRRLIDGEPNEVPDHDDWDCLLDCVAAELLTIVAPMDEAYWDVERGRRGPFARNGTLPVRVLLTEKGQAMCNALRGWKAAGGNFATFDPAQGARVALEATEALHEAMSQ